MAPSVASPCLPIAKSCTTELYILMLSRNIKFCDSERSEDPMPAGHNDCTRKAFPTLPRLPFRGLPHCSPNLAPRQPGGNLLSNFHLTRILHQLTCLIEY